MGATPQHIPWTRIKNPESRVGLTINEEYSLILPRLNMPRSIIPSYPRLVPRVTRRP